MQEKDLDAVSVNPSANEHIDQVVARTMSRRTMLKNSFGFSALAFLGGSLSACGGDSTAAPAPEPVAPTPPAPVAMMNFKAVATSSSDAIVVPEGYSHSVLYRWGDALLANSPAWKGDASESGAEQALQAGDNHDGMHFFPFNDAAGKPRSDEGLLVLNHEYCNYEYLFKADPAQTDFLAPWTLDKVRKAQHAHGVSVVHIKKEAGGWKVQVGSAWNRRIHTNTPMLITGPAAGHASMATSADPTGTLVFGTVNNCANGFTPWGTYLTCEENFNGYFGTTSGADTRNDLMKRYGLSAKSSGYRWEEFDKRFDYVSEPNESNRFGWVVEIDPFDPTSTPKKRTALGRIKHENAELVIAKDGRVVVYMGDDQAGEYIYKFVSDAKYDPANPASGRNLLDAGKLYVARFLDGATTGDSMGVGEWILLDKTANPTLAAETRFATQADVLVMTRNAADAVGATKMDRPEWVSANPKTGEVFCTLTNNSGRTTTDDANPRAKNVYGQIIRWREAGGDAAALSFDWDHFVIAGNPTIAANAGTLKAGSANITAENTFNSPDGLAFDADGRMWIQTDGSFANTGDYAGQGNNQMLVADPTTKEIRRFLVGPAGCEITGISFTPDQKTVFINVQHPGEVGSHPNRPTPPAGQSMEDYISRNPLAFSKWPDNGAGGRPRSATVVIWRDDGGKVGS